LSYVSRDSRTNSALNREPDNIGINARDRSDLTLTPGDQGSSDSDRQITAEIRRAITANDQFSTEAKNIKIITINGKVTLRGPRMWDFLDRLTTLALPRIRDFRGVPGRSFDGRGNFTLGLREQLAFPEIEYDKVDRLRGLEISIVTTAKTDEESKRLLELLGMPFAG